MVELAGPVIVLGLVYVGFLFLTGSLRAGSVLVWVLSLTVLVSFAAPLLVRVLALPSLGDVVAVLGFLLLLVFVGRRPRHRRQPKARDERPTSAKRRLERD